MRYQPLQNWDSAQDHSTQWYDVKSLGDLAAQDRDSYLTLYNKHTQPWKKIPVEVVRWQYIAKETLYRVRKFADAAVALYQGQLYAIQPQRDPEPDLYLLDDQLVHKRDITAVFGACFDVRYRYVWYRCELLGGKDEKQLWVVVHDPHNNTGLVTSHSIHEFGQGVELRYDQIEAVRICISDPINEQYFG